MRGAVTSAVAGALLAILVAPGFAVAGDISGNPAVVSGDTLRFGTVTVRLAGIDAPRDGAECLHAGAPFDCARIAATALMDLTAGVEVRCGTPTNPGDAIEARCSAGGYDLAEGMTYTGWARARPGADNPYRIFEQQARARGHGLWRPGYAPPPDW